MVLAFWILFENICVVVLYLWWAYSTLWRY